MSIQRKTFAAALAVALLGCAPQHENTGRDTGSAPSTTRNFFVDNGVTEVRYVRVAMHFADPKPARVLSLPTVASRQNPLLAKADVGSWKKEYADDRVSDGMRWAVEFVCGDKVIKRVDGFNAEPDGLKYLLEACGIRTRKSERLFKD